MKQIKTKEKDIATKDVLREPGQISFKDAMKKMVDLKPKKKQANK